MSTEESELKGKLYFKAQGEAEYKELGTVTKVSANTAEETTEIDIEGLTKEITPFSGSAEVSFKIRTYKRKKFKKLLMSRGIQRNIAETLSRKLKRNDFTLINLDIYFLGGINV